MRYAFHFAHVYPTPTTGHDTTCLFVYVHVFHVPMLHYSGSVSWAQAALLLYCLPTDEPYQHLALPSLTTLSNYQTSGLVTAGSAGIGEGDWLARQSEATRRLIKVTLQTKLKMHECIECFRLHLA